MTDNIGNEETTEVTSKNNTQADETTGKTYTQEEVDAMMARTRASVEHKTSKKYSVYEDLGTYEELKELKEQADKIQRKKQIEKGEFEKTLQDVVSKKDSVISKLQSEINGYKIDSPLLNAAAKYNSHNPEQVRDLLHSKVRVTDTGEVEVLGENGSVRYTDDGNPFGVDDLVRDFLDSNPHFVRSNPSTTNTESSNDNEVKKLDISKLDMKNPEHRALYAQYRKDVGLA